MSLYLLTGHNLGFSCGYRARTREKRSHGRKCCSLDVQVSLDHFPLTFTCSDIFLETASQPLPTVPGESLPHDI